VNSYDREEMEDNNLGRMHFRTNENIVLTFSKFLKENGEGNIGSILSYVY
jgi:hypothetical protein